LAIRCIEHLKIVTTSKYSIIANWKEWRGGRSSPSTSVSPANLHSTDCSIITIIYQLGLVQYASSGRSTKRTQFHPTNNSNQFFIIFVSSSQLQGQLQTQHSVDTGTYIMDKYNIKSQTIYRQALEENTSMQTSRQTKKL
jgi:hypothetical protein